MHRQQTHRNMQDIHPNVDMKVCQPDLLNSLKHIVSIGHHKCFHGVQLMQHILILNSSHTATYSRVHNTGFVLGLILTFL